MEKVILREREKIQEGFSPDQDLDAFISDVFSAVIDTFRFTDEEREALASNQVAQLIAAIPYVANCEDAKRTALAHLAIYFTDIRGGDAIFEHTKNDNISVYTRLRLISTFKGGDEKIIHHGMTHLAICMLDGYKRSELKDAESGAYNPLNDGSWNYEILREGLVNDIIENPCRSLDELMSDPSIEPSPRWIV